MLREGGVRGEVEELGTDYTYTGQREESALGLMYYVARWYDPHIAHFVQADTIVPGAGNPAAWDRYGYVMYNPVKYTDPSGYNPVGDDIDISILFDENKNPSFTEGANHEEGNKQEDQNNKSQCPSQNPDCYIIYSGEMTTEQLFLWYKMLEANQIYLITSGVIGTGWYGVKSVLEGMGFKLVASPYITETGADILASINSIEEMGKAAILDAYISLEVFNIEKLKDYVENLIDLSSENGGVADVIIYAESPLAIIPVLSSSQIPDRTVRANMPFTRLMVVYEVVLITSIK
jgi:RHS repeat-associated protein